MQKICPNAAPYAKDMPNMQKICRKYTKNMQKKYAKKYARNMQTKSLICKKCVKICKKIGQKAKKYAKNMQIMQSIPKICKICNGYFADGVTSR